MAVGVLIELPGLERKEYEEVTAEMFGHFPMKASEAPEKAVTGRVPDARPQFFEVQSLVQSR